VNRCRLPLEVVVALLVAACGGSGAEAPVSKAPSVSAPSPARRSANLVDDCAQEADKPPPEPLRIAFDGVAKSARCQREVYTIMGGLTHFLGVECKHCHQEPDYAADTHNKRVANWMARELVPKLRKHAAAEPASVTWCNDCHQGKPKILGNPRDKSLAIEWMTTHLVSDFEAVSGKNLKCRQCHEGDLGSPQFRPKIILTDLPGLPAPVAPAVLAPPAPAVAPAHDLAPGPGPGPAPSSSAAPVPDFGAR
jgi:hypothetical protein